jgi:Tfp pilus assembly protein PilF/uncharacterized protein (AIM24 family)
VAQAPRDIPPIDHGLFLFQLSRARKHLREGQVDLAREELEPARNLRPNDEDVLNLLSLVEFKRGRYDEAARATRTLLADNLSSAVLHSNLGLILFRAGNLGEAEQELRRALELKPDHVRSHLYLGLLYRAKGKLGLALEHLRFAGARRPVAEIEDALRRQVRESALRPSPEPFLPPDTGEEMEPELHAPLRLAPPARDAAATGPVMPAPQARSGDPAAARDTAAAPAAAGEASDEDAEGKPLFKILSDGALEIASRGVVFVRQGSVVWYRGKIRFSPEPAFRGTRLEKILRANGRGTLLVSDIGRRAFGRELNGESVYLEGSRLLALDQGLSFRLEPIHDFRQNRRVDVLRIYGSGSVILSVAGNLIAHEVSNEYPLIVSSRDLVAWSGHLVPAVVEDRFLEEVMQPDAGSAPKIRFEGVGTVLTEPPRPRRRASDVAKAPNDRRRGA